MVVVVYVASRQGGDGDIIKLSCQPTYALT